MAMSSRTMLNSLARRLSESATAAAIVAASSAFRFIFATLAGAAHRLLVLPLEAQWQWLAGAAGAISSGIGDLWQLVAGFFPHFVTVLSSAARELAPKLEALLALGTLSRTETRTTWTRDWRGSRASGRRRG
jgi:hypothetical protein